MDKPSDMMPFVKALASADRLRIVGVLVRGRAAASEIAAQLGLHAGDAARHLQFLTQARVVREADGLYELDEKAIESLARGQLAGTRPSFDAREAPEDSRRVLKTFLHADGSLRQIPPQGNRLLIVLNFIVEAFAFDAEYTEKEVNTVLRRFHLDTAALRRYLVDQGLMARESDGTKYWRVKERSHE